MTKGIASVQLNGDLTTVIIGDTQIMIGPKGKVAIFSDELTINDIKRQPAVTNAGKAVSVEGKALSVNGVKVELLPEGGFNIHTGGEITLHPVVATEIGHEVEEGVFAGFTADGKSQIFVMPANVRLKGSFNAVSEAIKKMNAQEEFGFNDWQIGSAKVVQIVRENLAEGPLKGSFKKTFHSDRFHPERVFPRRAYIGLTSTEDKARRDVATIRFTEAKEPGRLVAKRKLKALKRKLQQAFDKKHYYPVMRYGKSGKAGSQRYESKGAPGFDCRPVRVVPVPSV
jgi:hypothetical protein